MAAKVQVAFRFPPELVKRIDAYAERLARELPAGVEASRAGAVRALLERALAAEGLGAKGAGRGVRR